MIEKFLDEIRLKGQVRVLSSQDSHELGQSQVSPVITRGGQAGVVIQDRSSGKSWMIEVGNREASILFIKQLEEALNIAHATKDSFHSAMTEK